MQLVSNAPSSAKPIESTKSSQAIPNITNPFDLGISKNEASAKFEFQVPLRNREFLPKFNEAVGVLQKVTRTNIDVSNDLFGFKAGSSADSINIKGSIFGGKVGVEQAEKAIQVLADQLS